MRDNREHPELVRVVMAAVGLLLIAAFFFVGALLWAASGDGPCDGPTVADGCHRE
jgi:hypothetical protein